MSRLYVRIKCSHAVSESVRNGGISLLFLKLATIFYCNIILYTCWTAPSLTFDLLCRLRLMLDEAKLSPISASICTTNRMLGEALSNKCFIMPKSLNDNTKN